MIYYFGILIWSIFNPRKFGEMKNASYYESSIAVYCKSKASCFHGQSLEWFLAILPMTFVLPRNVFVRFKCRKKERERNMPKTNTNVQFLLNNNYQQSTIQRVDCVFFCCWCSCRIRKTCWQNCTAISFIHDNFDNVYHVYCIGDMICFISAQIFEP